MKRILIAVICSLMFITFGSAQNAHFCEQLQGLQSVIQNNHFSPKPLNDSLSVHVYQLFLEHLDPKKTLFTAGNIALFDVDKLNIDDYIKTNNCNFIDKYISTFEDQLQLSIAYIEQLSSQNLDYSGAATLRFTPDDKSHYFENQQAIYSYWNKRIRFKTIQKILEKDSVYTSVKSQFKRLEADAKSDIIEKTICRLEALKRRSGGISQFVKEAFLNALAKYQDPHTRFFNLSEKETFESSLAVTDESFGIYTAKNNQGDIIISHIITGSPAHKHGNIATKDVIVSLRSEQKELTINCISNRDVQHFLNVPDQPTITLTVKKQNGSMVTAKLTKALVTIEDNNVTGFVLERDSLRFGYIRISSFYTDLKNYQGLGVANDVAKEIYKLQKEQIQGLVIDLRNNGGGSMKEANDLSGMFIDRGPISILKYADGTTFTVKDLNRGMAFNKPLLLLVNHFSASASEYFASTMQDYHRAIIVGNTTHGKSSAQSILPLDDSKDLGFSKVTVDKFYRVTGQSIQAKGVIPDIILPSIYDDVKSEEAQKKFALVNDTTPITLPARVLKKFDTTALQALSQKRQTENPYFNTVQSLNQLLRTEYLFPNKTYALTLKNVFEDINTSKQQWNDLSNHLKHAKLSIVTKNSASTEEIISYNADDAAINNTILRDISNDIYIEEAYNILSDYINIIKHK